jgi:iron complex transport system substrate-binding protein
VKILRRGLTVLTAVAVVSTLAACGQAESDQASGSHENADSSGFPVKIDNIYGTTEITQKPERVATLSWVNGDDAIALGTVPVAMPETVYGGNKNKSTDWVDAELEKLGAKMGSKNAPKLYDESDGVNYDAIAEAEPDVILAAYSGLTEKEYKKLSKIAPVVGPIEADFQTSWKDSTVAIGQALGKTDEAKKVIDQTSEAIKKAGEDHPKIHGKTFIAGNLDPKSDTISVYTKGDNRSKLLTALGMKEAPVVDTYAKKDAFYFDFAPEKADELKSDVFFTWLPEGTTTKDLKKNSLMSRIPAITNSGLAYTSDEKLVLSVSAASPLSLQWGVDKIADLMTDAVQSSSEN